MRWRSGSSSGSNNSRPPVSLTEQLQNDDSDRPSDILPRIDDDEQDYSCPDHPRYEDDVDEHHRYSLAMGDSSLSGLPSSASHHREDLDEDGDLSPLQRQQYHLPTTAKASLTAALPPPEGQAEPPPPSASTSSIRAITPAAAPAVVIEDDDDDPGSDHARPLDDESDMLSPVTAWRPQNQQSTCEFTHTITHYSQKRESGCKKAEYSATTVDAYGNRWRLIVYVNGNGRASNNHLSLFLQVADADELPFGWKKAVSYVLTLEHPSGPSLGYAKRNPDKTFKLCPKAIDWGWSQFITSDRIQQEGYISDDSLTVRASVTVKSSSVSIDPEDAELYLKCAVEEGNVEAVKACLTQGAGVNCQFKDDLYTPLHTACSSSTSSGSLEVLKLLLERGADGNACNKWRETPLLIAANNGHRAAVEALLESGADPSLCSEAGWSALTFAAHKGYDDIVTLLLAAGAPVNCRVTEDLSTPLHKACAGGKPGHLSAVKQLLDGGADVHALNKWRETPLLTAANHGQAAAVEALLQAGADPCKCTDTGWSPLSIAAYKGHDDVVRILLEEGAPTEEADPTLSALLQAATKGLPDTVELLLRHGADHTVTTKKGDTALSILVEQNLIDAAVEMVTEYKASVPRCSRDRKKVQRARLLINLRLKHQQREGFLNGNMDTDDDDSEQDESDENSNSALHDSDGSPMSATPGSSKKKKKKKIKSRASAEAEARAAEEALLLELEKEDAKAQKVEAAATSKRAKKKKKREREKQQKLQEEKEQREKNEREAREREREQRLKEEKERKEREQKEREQKERERKEREQKEREQKERLRKERERKEREQKEREQRERESKETAEREKEVTAKRKEKEDRERKQRELEKKDRERSDRSEKKAFDSNGALLAARAVSPASDKKGKSVAKYKSAKKQQQTEALSVDGLGDFVANKIAAPKSPVVSAPGTRVAPAKKRGWETKNLNIPTSNASQKSHTANESKSQKSSQPRQASLQRQLPQPLHAPAPATVFGPQPFGALQQQQPERAPELVAPDPYNSALPSPMFSVEDQLADMATGVVDFLDFDSPPNGGNGGKHERFINSSDTGGPSTMNLSRNTPSHHHPAPVDKNTHFSTAIASGSLNDANIVNSASMVDLPSVAIFRYEKLTELLRRCALSRSSPPTPQRDPLSSIDEGTVRSVLYRWVVRASHDKSPFLDPVIPSWTEEDSLVAFFQRQFISESRRGLASNSPGVVSIEALKEAGTSMAMLCQSIAKELVRFRAKCEQQVPHDWSDTTINVSASQIISNGSGSNVVIDWAGHAQVYLPSLTFAKLRDRYCGPPGRLLTAIFIATKRYETKRIIVSGTSMDYRLPPATCACLSRDAAVSIELWSDPLVVFGNSVFCGVFPDVDAAFGGLAPFGKEEGGGEVAILKHGGSVAVLPPMESTTASLYVRKIVDLLERADRTAVPLSFAMFLPSECFRELNRPPTMTHLLSLDSRLGERHGMFLRCVELLPAGQHVYHCGDGDGVSCVSQTGSLFVLLQNEAGKIRFTINEGSVVNIVRSMSLNFMSVSEPTPTIPAPVSYPDRLHDTYAARAPGSFINSQELGTLSGNVISTGFGSEARSGTSRRGRLFELVDDGDDDNVNDVDVVSGMLNNLDLSMFQNSSQDVDIEAISLMGIGSTHLGSRAPGGSGRIG